MLNSGAQERQTARRMRAGGTTHRQNKDLPGLPGKSNDVKDALRHRQMTQPVRSHATDVILNGACARKPYVILSGACTHAQRRISNPSNPSSTRTTSTAFEIRSRAVAHSARF